MDLKTLEKVNRVHKSYQKYYKLNRQRRFWDLRRDKSLKLFHFSFKEIEMNASWRLYFQKHFPRTHGRQGLIEPACQILTYFFLVFWWNILFHHRNSCKNVKVLVKPRKTIFNSQQNCKYELREKGIIWFDTEG